MDCGVEQGDPLGPAYCAMVLARMMTRVRDRLSSEGIHIFDVWHLGDGQIACRPEHIESVLRAIDIEAAKDGACRAVGAEAKTVVRVMGSAAALATCGDEWDTDYVRNSRTHEPSKQTHVLGTDFGEEFNPCHQFREIAKKVADLHDALTLVEDTASELVLLRTCADVCKVVHLLRTSGPIERRASTGRL